MIASNAGTNANDASNPSTPETTTSNFPTGDVTAKKMMNTSHAIVAPRPPNTKPCLPLCKIHPPIKPAMGMAHHQPSSSSTNAASATITKAIQIFFMSTSFRSDSQSAFNVFRVHLIRRGGEEQWEIFSLCPQRDEVIVIEADRRAALSARINAK